MGYLPDNFCVCSLSLVWILISRYLCTDGQSPPTAASSCYYPGKWNSSEKTFLINPKPFKLPKWLFQFQERAITILATCSISLVMVMTALRLRASSNKMHSLSLRTISSSEENMNIYQRPGLALLKRRGKKGVEGLTMSLRWNTDANGQLHTLTLLLCVSSWFPNQNR